MSSSGSQGSQGIYVYKEEDMYEIGNGVTFNQESEDPPVCVCNCYCPSGGFVEGGIFMNQLIHFYV